MRAVIFCLCSFIAIGAADANADCVPGKFAGTAQEARQDPFPILITIICRGESVTGQVESAFGVAPISGGVSASTHWRLEGMFDTQQLALEASQTSDAWTGAYTLGPSHGSLTLHRDNSATFAQLGAEAPPQLNLAPAQWQADLEALAQEVPRQHRNAFHSISRREWESAVSSLQQRLPTLSPTLVPVALRELVARIGDAHTSVGLPPAARLPIGLFWFGGDLRIIETSPEHSDLLGAKILRIGNRTAQEAARLSAQLIVRENQWSALSATPYLLRRADVLRYYTLTEDLHSAVLSVRLSNGSTQDVSLAFVEGGVNDTRYVAGHAPIWRQQPLDPIWWRPLANGPFYINFRAYDQLRSHAAELMRVLDERLPAKVILDMRDNGGGDFTVFRDTILRGIQERPWLNRRDRLFVIIGREMFSAAMTNAADLRLHTRATLVGEPIGERPNSYQEVRFFSLPNSHLRYGVSTQYYEALPGAGNPEAVTPNVYAPPRWRTFARGEDDALEWIERH